MPHPIRLLRRLGPGGGVAGELGGGCRGQQEYGRDARHFRASRAATWASSSRFSHSFQALRHATPVAISRRRIVDVRAMPKRYSLRRERRSSDLYQCRHMSGLQQASASVLQAAKAPSAPPSKRRVSANQARTAIWFCARGGDRESARGRPPGYRSSRRKCWLSRLPPCAESARLSCTELCRGSVETL